MQGKCPEGECSYPDALGCVLPASVIPAAQSTHPEDWGVARASPTSFLQVLCVADVPSDLSWGEAHRGQEEAQRVSL